MRITKLSQTKENVKAYRRAVEQAKKLDQEAEEEFAATLIEPFNSKDAHKKNRQYVIILFTCSFVCFCSNLSAL